MMVLAVTTLSAALCLLLWRRLAYGSCRVCAVVLILLIPLGTIPGAITFLALVAPQLKSLAHVSAALVSVVLALALAWIPFSLGLLIAAFFAMLTGAAVETWGPGAHPREART